MEQQISMCYGLSTIKIGGRVVALTLKTKVNQYARKESYAYYAWKKIQATNTDLIRIGSGRKAYTHVVTAVATGTDMARLQGLVNQAQIMSLEAQLAFRKGLPLPEWAWNRPDETDDLPF